MSEDGSEVTQLVPLQFKAWAQKAFNSKGVSIEMPGFTAQGIPEARWRAGALIAAWLCRVYAIPPTWAKGGQGRGVCQHVDLGMAGGGHHDACGLGSPTWFTFMGYVKEAYDAFGDGPLPAFALHGSPNPALAELPPAVKPEPSHDGAGRKDGETVQHPTISGFPYGSVGDLQWRLNKAGQAPPLKVDGLAGNLTREAIRAFQAAHHLNVDGLAGPLTWADLNSAMMRDPGAPADLHAPDIPRPAPAPAPVLGTGTMPEWLWIVLSLAVIGLLAAVWEHFR